MLRLRGTLRLPFDISVSLILTTIVPFDLTAVKMGPKSDAYYKRQKEKDKKKKTKERDLINAEHAAHGDANESARIAEKQSIHAKLAELGRAPAEVPGDGSCLFAALLHQMRLSPPSGSLVPSSVAELRAALASFARAHACDYAPFVPSGGHDSGDDDEGKSAHPSPGNSTALTSPLDAYCAQMLRDDHWGSMLEVRVASDLFGAVVHVVAAGGVVHTMVPQSVAPSEGEAACGAQAANRVRTPSTRVPPNDWCMTFWEKLYTLGAHYNPTVLLE